MTHLRSYGLDKLNYINDPLSDLMIQENTEPSRKIHSQLDLPDSVEDYQSELLRMRVPETRPRGDDETYEEETRKRGRNMMNIMTYGNVQGDMDLAYKPEIEKVPQPFRKFNENQYHLSQKGKSIDARYACRGEAQKDDMMRHPSRDPKVRHSDARKYIPGELRTMPKMTIEDKEVPLIPKINVGKPVQSFRKIDNSWMLHYCKDVCRVDTIRKNAKIKRSQAARGIIEDVQEDKTNVVAIQTLIKGKKNYNAMKPEDDIAEDCRDDSVKSIEAKRALPTKKYINFGNITSMREFVDMAEKVNNIETSIKKSIQRPKLDFKTLDVEAVNEDEHGITEKKKLPNKANTFIIHAGFENDNRFEEDTNDIKEKEKRRPHRLNRATGYEPSADDDSINTWGREDKQIKKQQIRKLMVDMVKVNEKQFNIESKHHKTQKDLTKHVQGLKHADDTSENQFGRQRLQTQVDTRSYRRIDEMVPQYDDAVQEVQSKAYVNKAKQNRRVHPDSIQVSVDPYVDVTPKKKKTMTYDDHKQINIREYTIKQRLADD
jgi:hypothetical protein